MPELPEVETLRQDLSKEVVGPQDQGGRRWATAARCGATRAPSTSGPCSRAAPSRAVGRLGKYLLLDLDNGATLVVHLGMSGQLLRVKSAKEPKPKHTHVVITFTQGGELRYVDPRTFGEMFVSDAAAEGDKPASSTSVNGASPAATVPIRQAVPELAHLGLRPGRGRDELGALRASCCVSATAGIKALLMDQQFVAGIGNLYSDEILFAAGSPLRPAQRLACRPPRSAASTGPWSRPWPRRSSTGARRWPTSSTGDLFGEVGDYQGQHQVYDREGQPCRRCRNLIVRVKTGGRSTFFCEHCQV